MQLLFILFYCHMSPLLQPLSIITVLMCHTSDLSTQPRTAYGGTPTAASERKKSNKANAPVSSLEQQPKTKKARADSVSSRVGKENGGSADSAEADLLQRVLSLLQQPAAAAALTALPTTDTAAGAAAAQAALAEASFWKGQYEALQELRETAPEQRLRELRASLDSQVKKKTPHARATTSSSVCAFRGTSPGSSRRWGPT